MTPKQHYARLMEWVASPRGQCASKTLLRGVLGSTLAFLVYQLTCVGWSEIWQAVPTHPAFYVLFAVNYFLLPVAEAISFRLTWRFDFWRSLPAFFRKHVYNQDVIDYSGEVYLYVWAVRRLGRPEADALRTIKDNSILSSVVGCLVALVMPWACYVLGLLAPECDFSPAEVTAIMLAPLLAVAGCGLLWVFRRWIFSLPAGELLAVAGIHLGRFLLINLLTVVQWSLVMPGEPLAVWCTLLTAQNLIGRLPAVMRKDLIFVAAGIELSGGLSVPAAAVAGMLLVGSMLDRVTNALVFSTSVLASGKNRLSLEPSTEGRPAEACYEPAA